MERPWKALRHRGDKYAAPEGPPVRLIHENCGELSEARLVSACGKPFGPLDFKAIPGRELWSRSFGWSRWLRARRRF